jgi:hypothetical protein
MQEKIQETQNQIHKVASVNQEGGMAGSESISR